MGVILNTDIPTRAQVDRLLAARDPCSGSIYLATDPASTGAAERIELKNLASDAVDQLHRVAADVAEVARAATYGSVDTVLVDIDAVVPGSITASGAVRFGDADADRYGVVDEIARRVWLTGGRVLAVRRDDIPGPEPVAAILRYAPA
jgi:hypothetical protein